MRIIVLIKEVPDTWGERILNLETGLLERDAGDPVVDEINERALEVALSHRDSYPETEVVLISMGPSTVPTSLRKGLAMGADRAVHIHDDALLGADMSLTAEVLAAAVRSLDFDLVIAGNLSTDGGGGVVPSMLAELLGVAGISSLSTVEISDSAVGGRRLLDSGVQEVTADLPAVISITEALPDARFSNFKGIMAAKKKPFETLTLADLGLAVDESTGRSIVLAVSQRPARAAGIRIEDDGDAGRQIADFLLQNRLIKGRVE